jgi:hypothetical protein
MWMNIDSQRATIALNIYQLAESPETQDVLLSLNPQFRLLQSCYRALRDNSLDSIDGLLGCPVLLCAHNDLVDFSHQPKKDAVCVSLYYAINWFREVVNSFSVVNDPDIRVKVLQRVQHILELEQRLEECLAIFSSFVVPHYIFWADAKKGQVFNNKPAKRALFSKTKKANQSVEIGILGSNITPHITILRPYLRQFDLGVIKVVTYTVGEPDNLNSQSDTVLVELEPPVLRYLLDDFYQKLTSIATAKRHTFGHPTVEPSPYIASYSLEEIASVALDVFPALRIHLERISDSLLALNSKAEGNPSEDYDEDTKKSHTSDREYNCLLDCFILILQSFEKVFGNEDLYTLQSEHIIRVHYFYFYKLVS